MAPDSQRYRFGPLERRGLIAGWRSGQIASVGASLVIAVTVLHGAADVTGGVLAFIAVAGGIGVACWPIAGRSLEEWLPVVMRWTADGLLGRRRLFGAPELGHCMGPDGVTRCTAVSVARSRTRSTRWSREASERAIATECRAFQGLSILGVRATGVPGVAGEGHELEEPTVCVIHDARASTYTGALAVRGHSFALLGREDKERRVASWSSALAVLARDGAVVNRLQWLAFTLPDDGYAVHRHLQDRATAASDAPARRSYEELVMFTGANTCRHEVLIVVQIRDRRRLGVPSRSRHLRPGPDSMTCAALVREMQTLGRLLSDADVIVDGLLGPRALAAVIRRTGETMTRRCPPCVVGAPWPVAMETEWSRVRTDQTWQATYWIAEWPRVDVGPDFLAPLLLGPVRRSVSVVMEPMGPRRATKQVERARTADIADSELRRRGGFLTTARRAREAEMVVQKESELADGHASFRFSGYVTVTAPSVEALEEACEVTEHAAGQSRLELRRLYGDQERAFTCTLPLCRGLS